MLVIPILVIPIVEEELVVTQRQVIREEVRIRKRQVVVEQQVSDTVKREQLDISTDGDVNVQGNIDMTRRGDQPDAR